LGGPAGNVFPYERSDEREDEGGQTQPEFNELSLIFGAEYV
jgi:hypothetical protein